METLPTLISLILTFLGAVVIMLPFKPCFRIRFWSNRTFGARSFVRACIHCLSIVGGEKILRPLGSAIHRTKPNDFLQFDYSEMGLTLESEKYILKLTDNHPSYCLFFAYPDSAAKNPVHAVVDWAAAF